MSLFECKMCGGALEFTEGAAVAKCKYCGTAQTLPKTVDEIMQNLFVRANALRLKNEFDKAEKIYERIIQNDPTQSEAYWGLILCKYGIEYVDDPETKQKIPTCHRASYDSIIADDDFRLALEYADEDQRAVLDEQAREIDRIQKEILALAQKEETYDVFICYKETDENGKRTRDSVIANDIYYQLKQEGFKVFYAAITLENKLGAAYEPIIFAALHSAKVMLAIGTKPEYFNAVWVKNEWSRYLKVIQKDRTKLLIPCYRDMDAYELPDEFAHLQAQDMAKIGFINDLVRGIRKVVKKDAHKAAGEVANASTNAEAMLKRAFLFLEDEEWNNASEYLEKVLDQQPENAQAYLGKLMLELHVTKQALLAECDQPFDNSHNYEKAVRFADPALKSVLEGYIEQIRERNEKARTESIRARKKRTKRLILILTPLACLIVAAAIVLNTMVVPRITGTPDKDNTSPDGSQALEVIPTDESINISEVTYTKETTSKAESIATSDSEGLEYTVLQNTVSITGVGTYTDSILRIPSTIEGFPVTEIATSAFSDCTFVTEVIIPEGVTTIGYSAFKNCSNLTSINIPNSVTAIVNCAFLGCSGLTNVTIPNSVTSIGKSAFSNCRSLKNINIPNNLEIIESYTFYNCQSLENITISNSVTNIENNAFQNCSSLNNIRLSNSLATLGSDAFSSCSSLTKISIPTSLTTIGKSAFYNCAKLENIIYTGTKAQWEAIDKGERWKATDGFFSIYSVHCIDGGLAYSQ